MGVIAQSLDAPLQPAVILFGAFDRHNVGDLLFPHIAAALLPAQRLVLAGLAARDWRAAGGHRSVALASLDLSRTDTPAVLLHVGGEILTCTAWQAAVMLLPPDQAQATIAYLEHRSVDRQAWVHGMLGSEALAPYVVSRQRHPGLARVIHNAVGGVGLDQADPALRAEVLGQLRAADDIGVRDRQTQAQLAAAGIAAQLLPDPAVLVAELFGARIRAQACAGEVAQLRQAFAQGYIAVQFSADFGDDATLALIAAQLDQVVATTGLGVVLLRAGAAPWHDDLRSLARVAEHLGAGSARLLHSLDLWDLCALIASSRAFAGSSLHGRIVAMAFGRPRINLRPPAALGSPCKQDAYAATWEAAGLPTVVEPGDLAAALHAALAAPPELLTHTARQLATQYRQGFATLCHGLV